MTRLRRLPRPLRRLAAVALLALVLAGVYVLAVLPVSTHLAETRAEIDARREAVARLRAAAAQGGDTDAVARAATGPASGLTLDGDTEAIRQARLQTLVSETALAAGARVTSSRPLPPVEREGLRLVGARFDFRGDLATVQRIMVALESMQPLLIVDGLNLRSALGAVARPGVTAGELLDASLSVVAVEERGPASPPPASAPAPSLPPVRG